MSCNVDRWLGRADNLRMLRWLLGTVVSLGLVLSGCSSSAQKTDSAKRFIATHEPAVIDWERRAEAGEVSRDDLARLGTAVAEVEAELAKLEAEGAWTEKDRERAEALMQRFAEIAPRIIANQSWYP